MNVLLFVCLYILLKGGLIHVMFLCQFRFVWCLCMNSRGLLYPLALVVIDAGWLEDIIYNKKGQLYSS